MVAETYVIHVTKKCNCMCTYCYEKDKDSTYTWGEIQKVIDDIIQYRTSDNFHIEFLGGEPMLEWDYIKATMNYINNLNLYPQYTITTNGTIINDELIEYLKSDKYSIQFAISLDGHRLANMFRVFKPSGVNVYEKVIANIKTLLDRGVSPSVHITSHAYNIGYLSDSIKHLYKLGLRHIDVGTVESVMQIDTDYCGRFIHELDEVSKAICSGELGDLQIGLFNWIKPKDDVRTYVRDAEGKVVAESYGRAGEDFTAKTNDKYEIARCESNPIGDAIYNIRSTVFKNHHLRVGDLHLTPYAHLFK